MKTALKNSIITTGAILASVAFSLPAYSDRMEKTINANWNFRLPDEDIWHSVNIPHTYNSDAYSKSDYYRGKAVYAKRLELPSNREGKRFYLKFEAASKSADVKINGKKVGSHAGGYTSFVFDITDYLSDDNVLEVTVDNDRPDIAPISADFTFWGGIYRDVWLIETPEQHFNMLDMGSDGIFISTPTVNEKEGIIKVMGEITNDSKLPSKLEMACNIYAPDGKLIQSSRKGINLKGEQTDNVEIISKPIANPSLWSPESPSLYTVETCLYDKKSGKRLDRKVHKTGFRWFSFSGEHGFSLNGKPLKLRGFNRHQDQYPLGVAIDDDAHRRDIRLMKDLGANFIRIAHYPQDNSILEACDELGLLAWEEIPIVNIVRDTPGFNDNCETNLREMIRQHFNHPSVVLWGYMNEILLVTPGRDKKEWPEFRDRTVALAKRLEKALDEEDPSRNSVMAYNMTNLYNEIGLDLIDVSGWNLYQGWYVGKLEDFNKFCQDQHSRYPERPIIISEWGAGSDRRLHSDNPRPFDFSIEYQQKYIEHYLPFIENTEWICGNSYWNFIDFNVAARQESMPRINNKGAFYNNRQPKDVAFYFKSMWRNDIPVVHIASRDWPVRVGNISQPQAVKVYSNLPEIELFVNGESAGRKKIDNCFAIFNVKLPEGESSLVARGNFNGKDVNDVMTIVFNSNPDLGNGEELAINVGSNCHFISDISNLDWLPDRPYSPGQWGFTSGVDRNTTSEIFNTPDGPVYQTWREGDFSYKIDAPVGDYELELLMADVSKPAAQLANLLERSNSERASDAARFDIIINGVTMEKDFSPADGENFRNAFKTRYLIQNNDGAITLELKPINGKACLAGIKVRKI